MKSEATRKTQRIIVASGAAVLFAVRVAKKNNRRKYEHALHSN